MNAQTTRSGLFVLAFISAVLNYAGFTHIIDENDWWLKALCLLTAIGVWISLYLFWRHAFAIIPQLRRKDKRLSGWSVIGVGCVVIIALSTYWNAIAFTGKEALRLSLVKNVGQAEQLYNGSIGGAGVSAGLAQQLDGLATSASDLAGGEETSGAITGSAGRGGVSDVLRQIAANVAAVSKSVREAASARDRLQSEGKACLERMRKAVRPTSGKADAGGDALASGADCLNRVMSSLGNQNIASAVEQAMRGLRFGIVIPVSIRNDSQRQALDNILTGLQDQADRIADAASAIPAAGTNTFSLDRPNMAVAVIANWKSLIPAIATAIAIDLLPLILLLLGVIFRRDAELAGSPRHVWTVDELTDAKTQLTLLDKTEPTRLITHQPDEDDDWWSVDLPDDDGKPQ